MSATPESQDLERLPLTCLAGVGPVRASRLAALGFQSVYDLLVCVPQGLRRQGERLPVEQAASCVGAEHSFKGLLGAVRIHRMGPKRSLTSAVLEDSTGKLRALFFQQPWMKKRLEQLRDLGQPVEIYGELVQGKSGLALSSAVVGQGDQPLPKAGTVRPVYGLTEGIGQGFLQGLIAQAITSHAELLEEPLGKRDLEPLGLPSLRRAVACLNRPSSAKAFQLARRRLSLELLLAMQASLLLARQEHRRAAARPCTWSVLERKELMGDLPHAPTRGQRKVIGEILDDLAQAQPMGRLLQGDVGAGKTLVAQAALVAALKAGGQVCLLAPTELLAEQHQRSLEPWFRARGITCELLTGSLPAARRRATGARLASGALSLVIGTHALFAAGLRFKRLDLVVIDEQQRFGVAQKASLLDKGQGVHVLLMSATPIPRTLALSMYGDLDVSLLAEKPPGRGRLRTRVVLAAKRDKMIGFIAERMAQGEQVFWVRPRIDEDSDQGPDETGEKPPSLFALWHELKDGQLGPHGIEVVHGRMQPEERERRLLRFRSGAARLLLGTTIVEVGVDVPEASVMVIEGAERFGLSQFHQLRGRVGRGAADSWCFLLGQASARERLLALEQSSDGFFIAEQDLEQRGMGDLGGLRQAGGNVEGLQDPVVDLELVLLARRLVEEQPSLASRYGAHFRGRVV